jgi:hypothetical protein
MGALENDCTFIVESVDMLYSGRINTKDMRLRVGVLQARRLTGLTMHLQRLSGRLKVHQSTPTDTSVRGGGVLVRRKKLYLDTIFLHFLTQITGHKQDMFRLVNAARFSALFRGLPRLALGVFAFAARDVHDTARLRPLVIACTQCMRLHMDDSSLLKWAFTILNCIVDGYSPNSNFCCCVHDAQWKCGRPNRRHVPTANPARSRQ